VKNERPEQWENKFDTDIFPPLVSVKNSCIFETMFPIIFCFIYFLPAASWKTSTFCVAPRKCELLPLRETLLQANKRLLFALCVGANSWPPVHIFCLAVRIAIKAIRALAWFYGLLTFSSLYWNHSTQGSAVLKTFWWNKP